jgi:hypothetical protein
LTRLKWAVIPYMPLAITAFLRWLPTNFNVAYFGSDTIYPLDPTMNAQWLFSAWDPAQFGQASFYPALIPYLSLFLAFHEMGFGLGASQHIYEWLVAFAGAVTTGHLAGELAPYANRRRSIILFAGLVYLLAPSEVYLPQGWWATVGVPLAILCLIRALRAPNLRGAALWGVGGGLANLLLLNDVPNFEMQLVLSVWIVGFGGTAIAFCRRSRGKTLAQLGAFAATSVGAMAPLIIELSWSLAPTYASSMAMTSVRIGVNGAYGDLGHTTPISVLTLMSYYPLGWQSPLIRALSAVLPMLAFVGAARQRRDAMILGLAAATFLCITITVGPNEPVGPVYRWFMLHVPGSLAFRTVGKVHLFIAVGYAVLASIGVFEVVRCIAGAVPALSSRFRADLAIPALSVLMIGVVGKPILDGQPYRTPVAAATQPRIVPSIYSKAGAYLSSRTGRTLIYPDAGYTQERFPNGTYFGPSLTSYAFPRTVVYSRAGTYGAPASHECTIMYDSIDTAIERKPFDLLNAQNASIRVSSLPSSDIYRYASMYRIVPRVRRGRIYRVTLRVRDRKMVPEGDRLLLLRVGGAHVGDVRVIFDGRPIGLIARPDSAKLEALRIPNVLGKTSGHVVSLEFLVRKSDDALDPANLSIWQMGIGGLVPRSLLRMMLKDGIQYVFVDGASDNPKAALLVATLEGDPWLETILSDSDGRRLLRIRGSAHAATVFRGTAEESSAEPVYRYGRMSLAFTAPKATALVLAQNYSPLWRYWVSVDGGKRSGAAARPENGGSQTAVRLPSGSRFVVDGLYLPQAFLVLQYTLFLGVFVTFLLGCLNRFTGVLRPGAQEVFDALRSLLAR